MERLFDYLPNAIALIYVIDSSRAGGVENSEWVSVSFQETYMFDIILTIFFIAQYVDYIFNLY